MQLKSTSASHHSYRTALVPLADMLNHHPAAHIREKVFDDEKGVSFHAFLSCEKGSELFLNYGELHNKQLLQFYGFLSDDVRHLDTVALTLDPYSIYGDDGGEEDEGDDDELMVDADEEEKRLQEEEDRQNDLIEKKGRLLEENELSYEHWLRRGVISSQLIATLRILVADYDEAEALISQQATPSKQVHTPPIPSSIFHLFLSGVTDLY